MTKELTAERDEVSAIGAGEPADVEQAGHAPSMTACADAEATPWRRWSRRVVDATFQVADESDLWFRSALGQVDRGAHWTRATIGAVGQRAAEVPIRLMPGWARRRTPRERILKVLEAEARRSGLQASPEGFRLFAERMATLLEAVLNGSIRIEDIGFEGNDAAEAALRSESPQDEAAGLEEDSCANAESAGLAVGETDPR
jgi:hypothetical protein